MEFIRTFFRDTSLILTEPRRFFRERFPTIGFSQALAFGITAQWLASILEWLTRIVKHETLFDGINRIRESFTSLPFLKDIPDTIWNQAAPQAAPQSAWLVEVGALIVSPLQSLFMFCVSGMIFFIGGLILISKTPAPERDSPEPSNFIRLSAVSAAPALVGSILGFLPLNLGGFIGWVFHIVVLTLGISSRYRVSLFRACGVIFLPGLLVLLAFGCFLALIALGLAALFHGA